MSHRMRLQPFADQLISVGIQGGSMQSKLAQIVKENDLTPHEIRRIAEIANRDVHIQSVKAAHAQKRDARIRFELADAEALVPAARKQASDSQFREAGDQEKMAAAINAAGGDPFAVPEDLQAETAPLSLLHVSVDAKLAHAKEDHELQTQWHELNKVYQELKAVKTAADGASLKIHGDATKAHELAINAAVELIMGGVSLPSLYLAVNGAVEGSMATDEQRDMAEDLMRLIVQGLKDRKFPNHKMGFRRAGDIGSIDELGVDDLIALCKRSLGYAQGREMPTKAAAFIKTADQWTIHEPNLSAMKPTGKQPWEDAAAWLGQRPSYADHKLPQSYLDEAATSNTPNGTVRVINGGNTFVTAIRDLIGSRDRLRRTHAAQEYMGLKLTEISDALNSLKASRAQTSETLMAQERATATEQKIAVGPLVNAAISLAPMALAGLSARKPAKTPETAAPGPGRTV